MEIQSVPPIHFEYADPLKHIWTKMGQKGLCQWVMLINEQDALQGRDCLALIAFFHICSWKELT